jgi:type I restriction modification DNA specificity domain protein
MGNWKTCTIGELGTVIGGATPSTKKTENYDGGTISWITPKDLAGFSGRFISSGERNITEQGLKSCSTQLMPAHTVLFSSRAPIGYVAIAAQEVCTNQGFKSVVPNESTDYMFLYYLLKYNRDKIENLGGGTTFKEVSGSTMRGIEVTVPETIEEERRIASVLSALDDKIENNTEVNKNLQEQAQAIYREMFVNATNDQRQTCRAEEYFDIAIGKTPPRKEHQWFTTDPSDVTWVSISDMGSCGTYIRKSSEQLTQEAVEMFNIRVIPSNTVLLSFKLTVGRIAITYGEMTTNEAIAHFKTDKSFINEYLYCYLKDFNYQTMGSTSSIATAVNSKIIKAMPFVIPTDDEISRFHTVVSPMFEQILNNQLENDSLAELRDTLLPRLMSGELDVSDLDL